MNQDDFWIGLLLLFAMNPEACKAANKLYENEKVRLELQRNCPSVEWEQDMGASIPFCKLDGEMCNMQCRKNRQLNMEDQYDQNEKKRGASNNIT